MKYLGETARDSTAAMAINALTSIRAKTVVAKEKASVKVRKMGNLYPSVHKHGAECGHLCVRVAGSMTRVMDGTVLTCGDPKKIRGLSVWEFLLSSKDGQEPKKYYIIALLKSEAQARARKILKARITRYAGLARKAVSVLMSKAYTLYRDKDQVPVRVSVVANKATNRREIVSVNKNGTGTYTLKLDDNIKYALKAVKGGRATVELALQKACNKAVSVVNRRATDFLGNKVSIPTPFPEIRTRR